ncbi:MULTISPECIES: hypothetical protein [unclassified Marinomonas]|nr:MULTISPECIES: hypothetical protein [unclassified Marinomonas]
MASIRYSFFRDEAIKDVAGYSAFIVLSSTWVTVLYRKITHREE